MFLTRCTNSALCFLSTRLLSEQAKEVTLQEMNSVSHNYLYFYLIEVDVKYALLDSTGKPRHIIIDYSFFPACH